MTVTEHVAYLKGLAEGLEIDATKKEGKLLLGVLSALENLAEAVIDLQQQNEQLVAELDDVYEELTALTEDLVDDDEIDEFGADDGLYHVICPTCGEIIYLEEELLAEGKTVCHACGEELEFDKSSLDSEEVM